MAVHTNNATTKILTLVSNITFMERIYRLKPYVDVVSVRLLPGVKTVLT